MYLALTLVLHASNDIIYEGCSFVSLTKMEEKMEKKMFRITSFLGGFRGRSYKMRHFTKEKKDFKVFLL